MKKTVDYLQKKQIIFKPLQEVLPKTLGSRKRVKIFLGVDLKSYYTAIIVLTQKSRVLTKEVKTLEILHEKLETHIESKITKKIVIIDAPLCSKAKAQFVEKKWKVFLEELKKSESINA